MQEYERHIIITNQGPVTHARLKVIRLPTSWHGVIWESPSRYAAFGEDRGAGPGQSGHEQMDDHEFLTHVRLAAHYTNGVAFDYLNLNA